MKSLMLVVCICMIGLCLSANGAVTPEEQALENLVEKIIKVKDSGPERFREKFRQSLQDGTITTLRGAFLTKGLWSRMELMASRERLKIVADSNGFKIRPRLAKEALGN